ncbi:SMC-Scp complex subunit ScpB [Candidatus Kaiserbacteria bacterium]|nr:SMC-Scp complex subunit ScpB [Candidatus Kaiserbacteria bacterium]
MELDVQIEGLLFYKTEPMAKIALAKLFSVDETAIHTALETLQERLKQGATRLVETDTEVQLVLSSDLSELIESVRKDEMRRDIGKAGAETLALVLYRGPISRAEIDTIRGVNSAFILRTLLVRGLVEKQPNPHDARTFVYTPTPALFNHLGITQREDLAGFEDTMNALDTFVAAQKNDIEEATSHT